MAGYEGRGVVVSIYLDPEAEGVTASHLKAFEQGHYGPIFGPPIGAEGMMGDPLHRRIEDSMQSRPQGSLYTGWSLDYNVSPSAVQPIPRSFSQYPLGQAPTDLTKQYDTYISDQEPVNKGDAMDET